MKKYFGSVLILLSLVNTLLLCQDKKVYPKNDKILLQADITTTKSILGKGFDREMLDVGSVIKSPKIETINNLNQYSATCQVVTDDLILKGCGKYFVASGGFESAKKKRYSFLRIYQVTKVEKIDVSTDVKLTIPAKMVATAVYYGYLFDVMIEGTEETMSADIGVKLLGAGGDFSRIAKNYNLRTQVVATGLKPRAGNNEIVVATSAEDIQQKFVVDSKSPQPIFVEYKFLDNVEVTPFTFAEYKITSGKCNLRSITIQLSDRKPDGRKWDAFDTDPEIMISVTKINQRTNQSVEIIKNRTHGENKIATWGDLNQEIFLDQDDVLYIQAWDDDGSLNNRDYAGMNYVTAAKIFEQEYNEEISTQKFMNKKAVNDNAIDKCLIVISKRP
ncbi:MAG: hypothetical protein JNL32_03620 [Candidatus Kapabacteria bacterium]|nr:hypothetical protein [Candidatus Kapabacteria bacterium]